MTPSHRRLSGLVALLSVVGCAAACGATTSGGTGPDGGASEGGEPDGSSTADSASTDSANVDTGFVTATPRAIVRTNGGAAAGCVTVPAFAVGDFGDPTNGVPAKPVDNGGLQGGKSVAVTCRVAPIVAGGFMLAGSVAIASDTSFTINATLDALGNASAASFTLKGTTNWSSATCTLTPSASAGMGVAAGRYWATLACGGATSSNGSTCDIFGELRLENCAQQ